MLLLSDNNTRQPDAPWWNFNVGTAPWECVEPVFHLECWPLCVNGSYLTTTSVDFGILVPIRQTNKQYLIQCTFSHFK